MNAPKSAQRIAAPWIIRAQGKRSSYVIDSNGDHVVNLCEVSPQDANYIVAACNAYDALLAKAEDAALIRAEQAAYETELTKGV